MTDGTQPQNGSTPIINMPSYPSPPRHYRLLTRANFDGLVCAFILKELDMIGEIRFVHPRDIQDGKFAITENDITTGLPYAPGVYLAFDNHSSEAMRLASKRANHIINPKAASTARLVYDYLGGVNRLPQISIDMLSAVDKTLAAQYTLPEILNPQGWLLLNFILDPRTGLNRFKDLGISNYQLILDLVEKCKDHNIYFMLQMPDVQKRIELYHRHTEPFRAQLRRCTKVKGNLSITDFRQEEFIYAGNRFVLYAIYPECNLAIRIINAPNKSHTVITLGKSNFNRSSRINIGGLMLQFGGGGHFNAGTCQIQNDKVDEILNELIETIMTQ